MTVIRAFLAFEVISFAIASLFHSGLLMPGARDEGASTAEGVIGLVLFIGLLASLVWPERTRLFALLAQGFAIAGTSIGLFLLTRGLAPNTVPDVIFHIGIYVVLIVGLVTAWRQRSVFA